jgi:hypothetical protein
MRISLFIFKNLVCRGYWQSRWYQSATSEQIAEQIHYLIDLMSKGAVSDRDCLILDFLNSDTIQLQAPDYENVVLKGTDSEVQEILVDVFRRMDEAEQKSKTGLKKVILSWE